MKALKRRLERAIEEGVKARSAYYASIGLDDEQALGEPASEARIAELERRMGRSLPRSYREFLLLHNGWKQIDGGLDLVSVEELLGETNQFDIADWKNMMQRQGDAVAVRSLVIGASHITPTKYLLDPETVAADGEWLLLQYHHGVEAEIPSFIEWLEQSVVEYQELARQDPLDEDE